MVSLVSPLKVVSIARIFKVFPVINLAQNGICTSSSHLRKHWSQKFRKLRSQKVIKVDLPNYEEYSTPMEELSKEEIRSRMKEKGVDPARNFTERPFFLSNTGDVFEPYVPPEGDGKVSFITKEGAKQKLDFVGKKGKSMLAMRKLKKFDDDFEVDDFLVQAQEIYMNAHNAIMNVRKDKEELLLYVTEKAYAEMLHNSLDKTIHWKMIGSLEPPRLVQARSTDILFKENLFSQLTVRFHTQQMLAVYDRFGRLMYGSEILAKDVLEYIVFEKHIVSKQGRWRIHAKIIPDWMPPKDAVPKTFRVKEATPEPPSDPKSESTPTQSLKPPPGETPALATA